jgi:hyperosmotically inducible periplasmic protein
MRQRFLSLSALTLSLCLAAAGCARGDAGLEAKVKNKLATDETVKAASIEVKAHDGVVTLTGNVDSPGEKDQAIALARSTEGVRDVVDRIATRESDGRGNAPDTDRTAGEVIDDASVTRHVKAAFLDDPDVKGLKIDVDTREGVVYLTGTVRSEAERDRAVQLARQARGVRDVQANLKIQST